MKPIKLVYSLRFMVERLRKQKIQIFFLLFFLFPITYNLLPITHSHAEIPHLINYQGRLTDKDGKPLEGAYNVTFRIYDAESGPGTMTPWEEIHTGVIVKKGVFAVLLGSVKNLDLAFDKQYFLEIKIGKADGSEEVMSPRQRITSAGYAIRAEKTDTVKDGSITRSALENSVALSLVPRGTIVMWSGSISTIPEGWALCNGANGTPDLRKRFIIGADTDTAAVSMKVGSKNNPGYLSGADNNYINDSGTNEKAPGGGTCTAQHRDMMPPYYALAFIMKL